MFIVVLIVFGVCWLPYHTYFIYNYYADIASHSYTQHVFLAFFWLAMFNSAINPVIYCLMNAKYVIIITETIQLHNIISRFRYYFQNMFVSMVQMFVRNDFYSDESSGGGGGAVGQLR